MTADAASCSTIAAFILIPEGSEPKFWMHFNHWLSSAKAIPIQEVQKLLCVNAAAFDAEYLCMWCLAIPVDIFSGIFVQKSLKQLCKTKTVY